MAIHYFAPTFWYSNFNFSDRIIKYISKLKIFAPQIPVNLAVYV